MYKNEYNRPTPTGNRVMIELKIKLMNQELTSPALLTVTGVLKLVTA